MVGKFDIEIYNNKIHYFLTVKRNITILQGNSATGKTELIRLIGEHEANGASSGITLKCDAKCTVLTAVDWELRLSAMHKNIVFIDETAAFVKSKRFAEMVRGSDNYFVIVTRDDLSQLPYSVDEIYGLRNVSDNQKYKIYHRIYNEMYKLYHFDYGKPFVPELVITEDSNSGFEFFDTLYQGRCVSANGKSNVYDSIRKEQDKAILAIVDGAAFGAEIGKVSRYLETSNIHCVLYAPESFEYLILSADLTDVPKSVVEETYLHADSESYISWEEFYTSYLTDITKDTVFRYTKTKLAEAYKTEGAVARIASVMPEEIR
ncbi:MAG: translation initiation factor 2 [Ruminococcus flavefaciens]